jgi:uncharacterized peroxidase-related enzyme
LTYGELIICGTEIDYIVAERLGTREARQNLIQQRIEVMARIHQINPEVATGSAKAQLAAVKERLGLIPNMARAMANSPAVLDGYLQLSGALSKGFLPAKTREQIALAVAQANGCDYCLAAHTAIGKMVGLTAEQIRDSRLGTAVDAKTEALLRFARKIVETRGQLSGVDVQDVRDEGFDDGAIAEVVANVALNLFTNYFNDIAETDIDFPKVAELQPEPVAAN